MAIIDLTIERPALKRVERAVRKTPADDEETIEVTVPETESETAASTGSSGGRSAARRLATMAFVFGALGGAFYLFRRRRTLRRMASIEVDTPESDIEA